MQTQAAFHRQSSHGDTSRRPNPLAQWRRAAKSRAGARTLHDRADSVDPRTQRNSQWWRKETNPAICFRPARPHRPGLIHRSSRPRRSAVGHAVRPQGSDREPARNVRKEWLFRPRAWAEKKHRAGWAREPFHRETPFARRGLCDRQSLLHIALLRRATREGRRKRACECLCPRMAATSAERHPR